MSGLRLEVGVKFYDSCQIALIILKPRKTLICKSWTMTVGSISMRFSGALSKILEYKRRLALGVQRVGRAWPGKMFTAK